MRLHKERIKGCELCNRGDSSPQLQGRLAVFEKLGWCFLTSVKLEPCLAGAVLGLVMAGRVLGVGSLPLHRVCVLAPGCLSQSQLNQPL